MGERRMIRRQQEGVGAPDTGGAIRERMHHEARMETPEWRREAHKNQNLESHPPKSGSSTASDKSSDDT